METLVFWQIIAVLYFILAIATFIISILLKRYVDDFTQSAKWTVEKKGKPVKYAFFHPIINYLTVMMIIDIIVFFIAAFVALFQANIT